MAFIIPVIASIVGGLAGGALAAEVGIGVGAGAALGGALAGGAAGAVEDKKNPLVGGLLGAAGGALGGFGAEEVVGGAVNSALGLGGSGGAAATGATAADAVLGTPIGSPLTASAVSPGATGTGAAVVSAPLATPAGIAGASAGAAGPSGGLGAAAAPFSGTGAGETTDLLSGTAAGQTGGLASGGATGPATGAGTLAGAPSTSLTGAGSSSIPGLPGPSLGAKGVSDSLLGSLSGDVGPGNISLGQGSSGALSWLKGNANWLVPAAGLGLTAGKQLLSGGLANQFPEAGALEASASQLQSTGSGLINTYQTGTLPPGAQTQVDQATAAAKATVRSNFASMGLSGSSMEAGALAEVDRNAASQTFQIQQQLVNSGLNELQLGDQLYGNLLQIQLQQDQQLSDAIGRFAAAFATPTTLKLAT